MLLASQRASCRPKETWMPGRFDAVMFDFGGVFTASPFTAIGTAERTLGARPGELKAIIFGSYDRDSDHPWHRLERGEMTLRTAREEIVALGQSAGYEIDPIRLLIEGMGDHAPRTDLIDQVRRLRAEGFRTVVVTNNVKEFGEGWRSLIPVDELFDCVIDSSAVGCRKPDPAIFHLALQAVGDPPPERTIFLDDFEGNLRAARDLGIETVLVEEDYRGAMTALDSLLATP
jgi:putative hydrolase of the HAD superfamily